MDLNKLIDYPSFGVASGAKTPSGKLIYAMIPDNGGVACTITSFIKVAGDGTEDLVDTVEKDDQGIIGHPYKGTTVIFTQRVKNVQTGAGPWTAYVKNVVSK